MWGSRYFFIGLVGLLGLLSPQLKAHTCSSVFAIRNQSSFHFQNQEVFYNYKKNTTAQKTILLLHGLGDSYESLQKLSNEFVAKNYSVLSVDLFGHGKTLEDFVTTHRLPYKIPIDSQVEMLMALLDSLHIEKLHLAGHSYGGGVALKLAIRLQERALSLNLLATLVESLDNYYLDPFRGVSDFWGDWYKICLGCTAWSQFFDFWSAPAVEMIAQDGLRKYFHQRFPGDIRKVNLYTDAAMSVTRGIGNFNALESFKDLNISTPILIINTESDSLSPEKLNNQLFSKLNKKGYQVDFITIQDGDHRFPENQPELTAEIIRQKIEDKDD